MQKSGFELLHITGGWCQFKRNIEECSNTHCLLKAALSFVCNQVHADLDAAHCEHVGSLPSHLIFLRLAIERRCEGPGREHEGIDDDCTCSFHMLAILADAVIERV